MNKGGRPGRIATIDGVSYASITEAAISLNVTRHWVRDRLVPDFKEKKISTKPQIISAIEELQQEVRRLRRIIDNLEIM